MRRIQWVLAATVFAMLVAPSAKGQQAKEKPPLTTASGLLRIVSDPALGLMQRELKGPAPSLLEKVLYGVDLKKAIKVVSPEVAKADFQVARLQTPNVVFVSPGEARFEFSVQSFDERVPAEKLIEALRTVLAAELAKLDTHHQADVHRADLLSEQLAKLSAKLAKEKDAIDKLARLHRVPATPEIAAQQRGRLDAQIESASVELEGLQARRHALELQMAEVGKAAGQAVTIDPVIAELEQAVKLRQTLLDRSRALFDDGRKITEGELVSAQRELAEHKAELAKFRHQAAQAAGGARLVELRRRLEDTDIEKAEVTAKRKALVGMRDSIGFSAELDIKRLEIERLEASYREVGRELDELSRKLILYQPPEVTLISTP